MVVLGGLEFVIGGYLLHRHHKNKNQKRALEEEARQRRHQTFPAAKPAHPLSPSSPYGQEQLMTPQQKYACYAPQSPQSPLPQYQSQPQLQPHLYPTQTPPRRPVAQTFPQNRPVPQHSLTHPIPQHAQTHPIPQFQQQLIQPLQRSDSMATLSRMPIANGSRYSDTHPPLPPRPTMASPYLMPQRRPVGNSPYGHVGFSVSTPNFDNYNDSGRQDPRMGRNTVDDNWETYSPHEPHGPFRNGDEDDENDPPPPYQP